jgi:hypothetical protein
LIQGGKAASYGSRQRRQIPYDAGFAEDLRRMTASSPDLSLHTPMMQQYL